MCSGDNGPSSRPAVSINETAPVCLPALGPFDVRCSKEAAEWYRRASVSSAVPRGCRLHRVSDAGVCGFMRATGRDRLPNHVFDGGGDRWRRLVVQLGKPIDQRLQARRCCRQFTTKEYAHAFPDFFADRAAMRAVELQLFWSGHWLLPARLPAGDNKRQILSDRMRFEPDLNAKCYAELTTSSGPALTLLTRHGR